MPRKDVKKLGAGQYPVNEIDVSFGNPRDGVDPYVQVFVDQGEAAGVVISRYFDVVWVEESQAMVVVPDSRLVNPILKLPRREEQIVYRSVLLPDNPGMRGEEWRVEIGANQISGYIGAALELITGA